MPSMLRHSDPEFDASVEALLAQDRGAEADVEAEARAIIARVRAEGAEAVADLTRRFDRWEATPGTLQVPDAEIDAAIAAVPEEERAALTLAAERIRDYHARQVPQDATWDDPSGATLGWRWRPVDAAGLYVPGGRAAYPSSVLMNAIPAQVAGVERLAMAVPTPDGEVNPLVLLAARLGGIQTVWRIGGAQAIAALAYGAEPIAPVDVVTGPGNAWVTAAKRQVFGQVGIDMIAGPSEVLVIADRGTDPEWLAMDLMAQAEHDPSAQSILITDDPDLAEATAAAVDKALQRLSRTEIAGASWAAHGAIIVARDLDHAAALSNRVAPEHLQLCVEDPDALFKKIRHAGAVFLGRLSPEAIGDYVAGPNHVLPTYRSARFSSGLSALDFMKRTTVARMSEASLRAVGPAAERLANAEGLEAHGLSVRTRLNALDGLGRAAE